MSTTTRRRQRDRPAAAAIVLAAAQDVSCGFLEEGPQLLIVGGLALARRNLEAGGVL